MTEPFIHTNVPVERSIQVIKKVIRDFGCSAFRNTEQELNGGMRQHAIEFLLKHTVKDVSTLLPVRLVIEVAWQGSEKATAQKERQLFRAMYNHLKAKFVFMKMGLTTPEKEFLGDIVMETGLTVWDHMSEPLRKGLVAGEFAIKDLNGKRIKALPVHGED